MPPTVPATIIDDHARSILTENVVDDVDYRWTLNPYRGCELGCTYCYARGSHEYLDLDPDTDFATKLVVKRDAPELLRAAFDRPGWHPGEGRGPEESAWTPAFAGVTLVGAPGACARPHRET